MALDNLISISFTSEELQTMDAALAQIESVLRGKAINLSPEERQQYGSIANQNKILVDKARDYMQQRADLVPGMLDVEEFERDYQARKQLEERARRLMSITEQLTDTKTLLDHDNYSNTLTFYRYIRYLAQENEPGTTSVYQDLRAHFSVKRGSTASSDEAPSNSETQSSDSQDQA